MSLRTRLQVWIVALAGAIVVVLSALYLRSTIADSFAQARAIAEINAGQIESYISSSAPAQVAAVTPAPTTADELVAAYVTSAEQDVKLNGLLEQLMANSPVIVEGLVTGPGERIVAASIATKRGQRHAPLPPLEEFEDKTLLRRIEEVFSANQDYEVMRELGFQMEGGQRRVLTVRMILSSVLLREAVWPRLQPLAIVSGLALLLSMAAAIAVSRIAVRPLRHIGDLIDSITSGEREQQANAAALTGSREVAVVESKLSMLGERVRGAQDDANQLRTNIDQLLARLEDAVLLFGRDDRLVMAGGAVDRLVEGGRWQIMGRTVDEVFPLSTELGAFVQGAIQLRRNSRNSQLVYHNQDGAPVKVLLSIEILEEFPSRERIGTLVTLREAEPRKQIELQLDLSTRMAAISRLTSGAAHEIKNPLNSIALHLEVLKGKLEAEGEELGAQEIEVISREIRRLDRVVRSFLDFTRPVELSVEEVDLAALLNELAGLVRPDAAEHDVTVAIKTPASAWTRGDRDLLKQAILNVILNGIQAMEDGGDLQIELSGDDVWTIRIRDTGPGIPAEHRDKIYQLYFTTKPKGSGIGLAMTFQVIQLHGGTIEFSSGPEGTEFRLQLPTASNSTVAESSAAGRETAV